MSCPDRWSRTPYQFGMDRTPAQRLAMAEAAARRWFRVLEAMAMSDVADEIFCLVHTNWVAAHGVVPGP